VDSIVNVVFEPFAPLPGLDAPAPPPPIVIGIVEPPVTEREAPFLALPVASGAVDAFATGP
jgi:hypothetical protein